MILPIILALIPHVPGLIKDVEGIFGHGKGVSKKAAVTNILSDSINSLASLQGLPGANSNEMALVSQIIEAVVEYFNSSGQFTHGGTK